MHKIPLDFLLSELRIANFDERFIVLPKVATHMWKGKIVAVIKLNDDVLEEDNGNAKDMKLFHCELEQSDGGHRGRRWQPGEKDVFIFKPYILKH